VRPNKFIIFFALFLILILASSALSEVDWQIQKTLNLQDAPVDMVLSRGGSYLYVLTDDGTVHVYSTSGILKGRMQVGKDTNSLAAGPSDDIIFVKNAKEKSIKRILIDFVYEFNLKDSPFKGNAEAPVTIVVFSDFQ
jgi:hypothetical protein